MGTVRWEGGRLPLSVSPGDMNSTSFLSSVRSGRISESPSPGEMARWMGVLRVLAAEGSWGGYAFVLSRACTAGALSFRAACADVIGGRETSEDKLASTMSYV
jgi:hypothetical protein